MKGTNMDIDETDSLPAALPSIRFRATDLIPPLCGMGMDMVVAVAGFLETLTEIAGSHANWVRDRDEFAASVGMGIEALMECQ